MCLDLRVMLHNSEFLSLKKGLRIRQLIKSMKLGSISQCVEEISNRHFGRYVKLDGIWSLPSRLSARPVSINRKVCS